MSRRISTKKRFPQKNFINNNYLISLLINKLMKNGKKKLAQRIIVKSLSDLQEKSGRNPIAILEKAIRNISPRVQLKAKRKGGSTYQLPTILTRFRSINLGIKGIVDGARKRGNKFMFQRLSSEIFDASKNLGLAYRKKQEIHRTARSNKSLAKI
jgi:small subunit ribosomal protein S7